MDWTEEVNSDWIDADDWIDSDWIDDDWIDDETDDYLILDLDEEIERDYSSITRLDYILESFLYNLQVRWRALGRSQSLHIQLFLTDVLST